MSVYGYVKREYPVPTAEQLAGLITYNCSELFIEDEGFGATIELKKMMNNITLNDHLVLYDLKTIWTDSRQIRDVLEELVAKNIRLISINNQLDTAVDTSFFKNVLLAMKTEEGCRSDHIKKRIEQSRLEGKKHGRPSVDEEIVKKIQFLFSNKKLSMREISRICGVSLGTVHKYCVDKEQLSS